MITKEFESICNMMLSSRMQNVDTTNMKSYKIDKSNINSDNALYKSAVADSSALSLVYTSPGYDSLGLMMDRARAIMASGETPSKIAVLCTTDVSAQLVKNNVPQVQTLTTQDFIDQLYCANYSNCWLATDDMLSANIKLDAIVDKRNLTPEEAELVKILDMADSQDKAILISLYANNHKDALLDLTKNYRLRTSVEAICQNTTYSMPNNPFDINAIILNNVSNVSIPVLCTIIGYANRYHTNLYLVGAPEETIYSFQASYKKALDIIASFSTDKNIGIIRLENNKNTHPDIPKFMKMKPIQDKSIISIEKISAEGISNDTALKKAFDNNINYITEKLNNHERVLICAPYSRMLEKIKPILEKTYPSANIYQASQKFDLPMRINMKTMMDIYDDMSKKYTNDTSMADFLFDIVKRKIPIEAYNKTDRAMTSEEINQFRATFDAGILRFCGQYNNKFDITTLYRMLLQGECATLNEYYAEMKKHKTVDSNFAADIVLSTIHTAIDMQYSNVVIILPDQFIRGLHFASCGTEELLYQRNVVLTRAKNSEHIILLPRENKSPFLTYVDNL